MRDASFKYEVALSFAGEDRTYVEKVADALARKGLRVFYDRHEEVELWGKDLYEHLSEVYSKRARFVVLFISRHYKAKLWTNHERKSAQARAFKERKEYILPARFDRTRLPGILDTVGCISLDKLRPHIFANMILEKCRGAEQKDSLEKSLGFHMQLSENCDRILPTGDTVITQTLELVPLRADLRHYEFYHWQDSAGKFAVLRSDVLSVSTGEALPHSLQIVERTSTSMRLKLRFKNLGRSVPLKLIFEIRAQNYFPNLLSKGIGYTDFLARYTVDSFKYALIAPDSPPFDQLTLNALHNERKRRIRPFNRGGQLVFPFGPVHREKDDLLKFSIRLKLGKKDRTKTPRS